MTTWVGILCGDKSFKRLFYSACFIFITITLFFSNILSVFAQNVPPQIQNGSNINYNPPTGGPYSGPGPVPNGSGVGTGGATTGAGAGQSPQQASEALAAERLSAEQAAAANAMVAENLGATPDGVLGFFYNYVLTGIGWVVGQAGKAFDYAITEYVLGFGAMYVGKNIGNTIDGLWSTVRDIFNLTFIFGLVYIGFKMILDSSDSSARKMLVSLIGAALLVNFSLFITKFVVDFSNIAAAQIWKAFASSGELSITNGFMTLMGIQGLLNVEYTGTGSFAYVIGTLIIFAVLGYVFLAGAIMIIIRFVVLNIYMVFSPVMFLGWVFPSMQGHSSKYWKGFLSQAFFAPAFLFMLYLSYKVASSFNFEKKDIGHIFNPNGVSVTDASGLIPFFAMVIVFLCASMVVAKNMGAVGATTAISVGNKVRGRAQNALTYMPRAGARMALNKAGESAEKRLNQLQTRGGALGWLASTNTVDRALRGTAQTASKAKLGTVGSNKDQREYAAGIRSRANQTSADKEREAALKNSELTLGRTTANADDLNSAFETLGKTIKDMSGEQREYLGIDKLKSTHIATHLTDSHIEALEKSGKFSKQEITDIKTSRSNGFKAIASSGHTLTGTSTPAAAASAVVGNKQREALMNRSVQEIGKMPTDLFIQDKMAKYITPQMLQEKMKNGGITGAQLNEIKDNIERNVLFATSAKASDIKMWRTWSDNNTYGAQLGLNFI